MTLTEKIRVLIAKPGLDGHDRGAKVVAQALRDAGMEVIYTGIRQTPELIAEVALQEDVDVVGLSSLTGAHKEYTAQIVQLMQQKGMDTSRVVLVVGGIIPPEDVDYLRSLGVEAAFGPGSDTRDIAKTISAAVQRRREAKG